MRSLTLFVALAATWIGVGCARADPALISGLLGSGGSKKENPNLLHQNKKCKGYQVKIVAPGVTKTFVGEVCQTEQRYRGNVQVWITEKTTTEEMERTAPIVTARK